jgi:hypothetical protein
MIDSFDNIIVSDVEIHYILRKNILWRRRLNILLSWAGQALHGWPFVETDDEGWPCWRSRRKVRDLFTTFAYALKFKLLSLILTQSNDINGSRASSSPGKCLFDEINKNRSKFCCAMLRFKVHDSEGNIVDFEEIAEVLSKVRLFNLYP